MTFRLTTSACKMLQRAMATNTPLLRQPDQVVALELTPKEKLAKIMTEETSIADEAITLLFSHFLKMVEVKKGAPLSRSFQSKARKVVEGYSLNIAKNLFRQNVMDEVLVHLTKEDALNAIKTLEGKMEVDSSGWQKLTFYSLFSKELLEASQIHEVASHWDRWQHDLKSLIKTELLKKQTQQK